MTDAGPTPIAPKRLSAFISHHSSQVDIARRLKGLLAGQGIDGWLAPDDIAAGTAFDQAILDQIARSDAIILLFCAQSDQSRHVKRELMLGEDGHKQILPVRLEDVPAQGLAYWLKDYQWIDWFGGEAQAVDRIVAAMTGAPEPARAVVAPSARHPKYRLSKLALAVAAIAIVAAGAWWAVGQGKNDGDASAEVADSPIEPGVWTSKREVVKILYPEEIAPEYEKQFKALLENDPDPEDCITEKVAAKPDVELFDPGHQSSCTIGSFKMNGGRISGYLNCKIAGDANGNLQVTVRGTYTRTSMEFDNVVTMQTSQGMVRFRSHETQRWLRGPACKA
ncbi:TIR domain-containing protein [Sphingopyxis sp. BSN-002]|uniref:TIR domain-containing protein n=1 Tax=Sphingopyxis sp. BSN-002 TaxID=2911495 RepID=UPI001EDA87E7|nr:TIR domain-containing protein [Sphingopyxis sp. BSN-002]UKK84924.1 TIR domain-containing protein [Sphingopyxis sp. BSN-002]